MPQGGECDGGLVLLGHRLRQRGHLVDVGDPAVGHPVCAAAFHPARVLDDQVVENGCVEDGLEEPVGGASDAGRIGGASGEIGVPGSDVDRRDLGQLLLAEGRLQLVLDEPAILLPGAGPDVGALGRPDQPVAAGDPARPGI